MIEYVRKIGLHGGYVASDPIGRFERSYSPVPECGCWIWLGAMNKRKDGYGRFFLEGAYDKAHRAAYRLFVGPIPNGLQVLHKCDVRMCVNPAHLFLGTNADNVADRDRKGRHRPLLGSAHGMSKLTEDAARLILASADDGPTLAARFGVSISAISLVRGITYLTPERQ